MPSGLAKFADPDGILIFSLLGVVFCRGLSFPDRISGAELLLALLTLLAVMSYYNYLNWVRACRLW